MALNRKPGIATPREADRGVRNAVDAIRARLEAIETLLNNVELIAGTGTQANALFKASISNLQQQINVLNSDLSELTDLLNGTDGLVVVADGQLITRTLEAGTNVTIDNSDGVDGNPVINSSGSGSGYPFITNELDDDVLTETNHRIRVED